MSIDVTVVIDGIDYSADVVTMTRRKSLKDVAQQGDVVFSSSVLPTDFSPNLDVVLYEQGVKVFTGYVDKIRANIPDYTTTVSVRDTYKLLQDYFLHDANTTSGSETALSIIDSVCALAGISYSMDVTSGSTTIPEKVSIGQRFGADIVMDMCGLIGCQMRVDADGVLHFVELDRPTSPDWVRPYERAAIALSDSSTRNVAKVWGSNGVRVIQSTDAGIPQVPQRIMVYANPNIDTDARANTIAAAALDQFGSVEIIGTASVIPSPNMDIGSSGSITGLQHNLVDTITDLEFESSKSGYVAVMTLGRRAPRFPTFPVSSPSSGSGLLWDLWESPGKAYDTTVIGIYSYTVGATYSDFSGASPTWTRIEKRFLATGVLVWSVDIDAFSSGISFGTHVANDGTDLYIRVQYPGGLSGIGYIKVDGGNGNLLIERDASYLDTSFGRSGVQFAGGLLYTWNSGTPDKVFMCDPDMDFVLSFVPPSDSGLFDYLGTPPAVNGTDIITYLKNAPSPWGAFDKSDTSGNTLTDQDGDHPTMWTDSVLTHIGAAQFDGTVVPAMFGQAMLYIGFPRFDDVGIEFTISSLVVAPGKTSAPSVWITPLWETGIPTGYSPIGSRVSVASTRALFLAIYASVNRLMSVDISTGALFPSIGADDLGASPVSVCGSDRYAVCAADTPTSGSYLFRTVGVRLY